MADINVTINPAPSVAATVSAAPEVDVVIGQGIPNHAVTHAPGGSDSLESYYLTASGTGVLTGAFYPLKSNPSGYVQGAVVRPSNTGAFLDTGSSQTISSLKNFTVRPTVNGTGILLSGESAINTGVLTGAFYPLNSNPSGYITGVDLSSYVTKSSTGSFVTTGQTGNFVVSSQTGAFLTTGVADSRYALQSATGSFITSGQTGQFVTTGSTGQFVTGNVVRPSDTGAFLTTGAADSRYALQSATGIFVTTGQTGIFITSSQTGQFVSTGSTGSFITSSQTGQFVSTGATGNFVTGSVVRPTQTGAFLTTGAADARYALQSATGSFITTSQTGQFVATGSTGNFVVSSQTGAFLTTGAADSRYALQSQTGVFVTTGQTGVFITSGQTGQFYPSSNPSGYITGVNLSSYATTGYVTGVSGDLQNKINTTSGYAVSGYSGSVTGIEVTGSSTKTINLYKRDGSILSASFTDSGGSGSAPVENVVYTTGNQDISGLKDFQTRPTVLDVPVLVSGDPVEIIHLYAKNDEPFTLNKGQPVYIGGANGANPLIKMASNTGEFSSSKTIGLLAQTLNPNDLGYVITEGALEGFDTSAGTAGDPMWLGPTGQILYGTGNKPYGLNNLVYLGVVLRSQSVNGKVYVQIQNGFEVEELHNVYALNASDKDTLLYNSASGAWFARQISTGDVSGINNYALKSETGSFITTGQTGQFVSTGSTGSFVTGSVVRPSETGAFLTTGAADNRYALQSSTGSFVTTGQTGIFITSSQTGAFLTTGAGDGRYALQSATGNFITSSQTGQFVSTGSTGNFVVSSQTGSFLTTSSQYVQEIYIDAAAMLTGISGATPTGVSILNSGIAYDCYSFDSATTGFTQFKFMVDDYNLSAMKAKFHWTAPGTATGGVVWGIQSQGVSDTELLNFNFVGGAEVTDTFSTGTGFFTSAAATFTPSGTLVTGDMLFFRIYRSVANANDDLGANAYLLGVSIQYTGNRINAW